MIQIVERNKSAEVTSKRRAEILVDMSRAVSPNLKKKAKLLHLKAGVPMYLHIVVGNRLLK